MFKALRSYVSIARCRHLSVVAMPQQHNAAILPPIFITLQRTETTDLPLLFKNQKSDIPSSSTLRHKFPLNTYLQPDSVRNLQKPPNNSLHFTLPRNRDTCIPLHTYISEAEGQLSVISVQHSNSHLGVDPLFRHVRSIPSPPPSHRHHHRHLNQCDIPATDHLQPPFFLGGDQAAYSISFTCKKTLSPLHRFRPKSWPPSCEKRHTDKMLRHQYRRELKMKRELKKSGPEQKMDAFYARKLAKKKASQEKTAVIAKAKGGGPTVPASTPAATTTAKKKK